MYYCGAILCNVVPFSVMWCRYYGGAEFVVVPFSVRWCHFMVVPLFVMWCRFLYCGAIFMVVPVLWWYRFS